MKLNKKIQFIRRGQNGRRPSNYPLDGAGVPMRITNFMPKTVPNITAESLQEKKKDSDIVCLPEMMSLFNCLSQHEFDKFLCKEQALNLQNCYSNFVDSRERTRAVVKSKK